LLQARPLPVASHPLSCRNSRYIWRFCWLLLQLISVCCSLLLVLWSYCSIFRYILRSKCSAFLHLYCSRRCTFCSLVD
jgi:hypothetical protein